MSRQADVAEWLYRQYLDYAQGCDTLDDFADWLGLARRTLDRLLAGRPASGAQFERITRQLAEHYGYAVYDFLDQTGLKHAPDFMRAYRRAALHRQIELSLTAGYILAHRPAPAVPVWEMLCADYYQAWAAVSDSPRELDHIPAEYERVIFSAIQAGEPLPEPIIAQSPAFSAAYLQRRSRIDRFRSIQQRAWSRTHARCHAHWDARGIVYRRQDGQSVTAAQATEIITELDEVEAVVGSLADILRAANVLIVHTNGRRPFFTPRAGGLYVPAWRTLVVGCGYPALAHEIGHLLDHLAGHAEDERTLVWQSDWEMLDAESLVRDGRRRFARSETTRSRHGYWREPCEIWARLFEQYVRDRVSCSGRSTQSVYIDRPGYWSAAMWAALERRIGEAIALRLATIRQLIAGGELASVTVDALTT